MQIARTFRRVATGLVIGAAALHHVSDACAKDAKSDGTVVEGELGRSLDACVAAHDGGRFWGAVLVAKEGRVVLAKGWGASDDADSPNGPHTLFELASASKQVTATAILHLAQRKKLTLDDTLERFFDKVPNDKAAITLRQVLTHTSGLSPEIGVPYASPIARGPYEAQMLAAPLVSEPGKEFHYANAGYALLAAVVEEVTGKPFEEYVEKQLFAPAKLTETGFIGDRDLIRSGRAARRRTDEPGKWTAADWHWGWGYRGMGGVVTSISDLWLWDRALRGGKLLSDDTLAALHTPALQNYACGWIVDVTERGTRRASHSGSVRGFGCNLIRLLDEDAAVFVLSDDPKRAVELSGALERLLYPPPRLEATIEVRPFEFDGHRVARLPADARVHVRGDAKGCTVTLRTGKTDALELRAPRAFAAKLTSQLEQALAARAADDDGKVAAVEAALYLGGYDAALPKLELREGLTFDIEPEYRGQAADGSPVVDRRVLVVLRDTSRGQWPMMAKLNVAAARALLEELRALAK